MRRVSLHSESRAPDADPGPTSTSSAACSTPFPSDGQQAVWTERPARGSLLHAPHARLGFDSATRTREPPRRVGAEDCHATLHAELSGRH